MQPIATKPLEVRAHWDAESGVWWAESDDIPGLVTEAPTFDALVERALAVIPELLEVNGVAARGDEFPIHVMAERTAKVKLRA